MGKHTAGDDKPDKQMQADDSETPLSEWVVAAVGLVLVVTSLGYLAYEAVAGHPSPPDIIVQSEQVVPMTESYLLKIAVTNKGGQTVANLRVKGRLVNGPGSGEENETTFDYVPAHSTRKGGLLFRQDPRASRVELGAGGYQEP